MYICTDSKESACNAGDLCLIPGSGKSPGEGIPNHSSLLAWRMPRDRGAWWTAVHRVAELDMVDRLSTSTYSGGSDSKESACSAGDLGLIPGSGKSPGEGNSNPFHILAWRIPWREEPGGLQSMGHKQLDTTE